MARSHRLPLSLLVALAVLASPATTYAQTLTLAATGGVRVGATATAARLSLRIDGASEAGGQVDVGLAYDGAAQLDVGMRAENSFGLLGNVIAEASLALRSDREAQGSLGVRGVLGPVALGVKLSAFSADPDRFDPLAVASANRPLFGSAGWGAQLDVIARPTRRLILEANPAMYLLPGGVSWRTTARLRWLRALGPHELSLRLLGYLRPGAGSGDGAVGVGFTYRRRRAPDLDGALYLGVSPHGVRPGVTAAVAQQFGAIRATLALALEPYLLDVPPYRLQLGLAFALGAGEAHVAGALAAGPDGTRGVLGVRYTLPIDVLPRSRVTVPATPR